MTRKPLLEISHLPSVVRREICDWYLVAVICVSLSRESSRSRTSSGSTLEQKGNTQQRLFFPAALILFFFLLHKWLTMADSCISHWCYSQTAVLKLDVTLQNLCPSVSKIPIPVSRQRFLNDVLVTQLTAFTRTTQSAPQRPFNESLLRSPFINLCPFVTTIAADDQVERICMQTTGRADWIFIFNFLCCFKIFPLFFR